MSTVEPGLRPSWRVSVERALDTLWPTDCAHCGVALRTRQRHGVCLACWAGIRAIRAPWCSGCGLPLVPAPIRTRSEARRCVACVLRPLGTDGVRAAVLYAGAARTIVLHAKRGRRPELLRDLGRWVAAVVRSSDWRDIDRIVAVPGSPWSNRVRGFDPARVIAAAAADELGIDLAPRALRRRWTSPGPVKTLPAGRREDALRGAIRARSVAVEGRSVLLIDDVVTSGSTVRACARALRDAGARAVRVACWARTPL